MTIGLILLSVLAILVFFGATERLFRRMGIANWLAFILVLALVAGAVVPQITIGQAFAMNVGGFIVPLVFAVALAVLIGWNAELFRAGVATLAVASAAVAARMLILPVSAGMTVTASVIVGFVGGAVAFIIAKTRLATLAAALGGIVIGDVVTSVIYRYFVDGSAVALGTRGVFDSLVIAAVFGVLLVEVIASIRKNSAVAVGIPALEAGEDTDLTGIVPLENIADVEIAKEFDGSEERAVHREEVEKLEHPAQADDMEMGAEAIVLGATPVNGLGQGFSQGTLNGYFPLDYTALHFNEEDYEDYFNDDID